MISSSFFRISAAPAAFSFSDSSATFLFSSSWILFPQSSTTSAAAAMSSSRPAISWPFFSSSAERGASSALRRGSRSSRIRLSCPRAEARFQVPENVGVGDIRRWGTLSLYGRDQDKAALERPLRDSSQEIQRWDNGQAGFLLPEGVDERRVIGLCFDEVGQAAKGLRDVFAGRWPADPLLHFFQGIEPVAVLFPGPPGLFDPLLEAGGGGAPVFPENPELPAPPFLFFLFGL